MLVFSFLFLVLALRNIRLHYQFFSLFFPSCLRWTLVLFHQLALCFFAGGSSALGRGRDGRAALAWPRTARTWDGGRGEPTGRCFCPVPFFRVPNRYFVQAWKRYYYGQRHMCVLCTPYCGSNGRTVRTPLVGRALWHWPRTAALCKVPQVSMMWRWINGSGERVKWYVHGDTARARWSSPGHIHGVIQ